MDGIIIVNKEAGYTSHDVVAKLRGILHQKKIGHTGTLDPDATGVLPICIGRATKVCDVLTDRDKTYLAEVVLGITTDTLDISGNILSRSDVHVKKDDLLAVLSHFEGEITQIPPMYSAVKVNGKKLYEYAREGQSVERKPRYVTIYELEPVEEKLFPYDQKKSGSDDGILNGSDSSTLVEKLPSFKIRVKCSKGTYIRTLCDDIGRELGCGAVMKSLVRMAAGRFEINNALTISEIEESLKRFDVENEESLPDFLIPLDSVFDEYHSLTVPSDQMKLLENGNPIFIRPVPEGISFGDTVRVYGANGEFYALYRLDERKKRFVVVKYFH
ncbi:MAG: tRNA pseudouridine(55) synthase TruB [Eubacterium sp.]|nr:tRNA pseudouridine(55) synthase TruB [Eubacterium sp.]